MLPTISVENIATKSDFCLILVGMFLLYALRCNFTRRIRVTVPIRRTQIRESSESGTKKVVFWKRNKLALRLVGKKRECGTLKRRSDAASWDQNYSFPKRLNIRFSLVKYRNLFRGHRARWLQKLDCFSEANPACVGHVSQSARPSCRASRWLWRLITSCQGESRLWSA